MHNHALVHLNCIGTLNCWTVYVFWLDLHGEIPARTPVKMQKIANYLFFDADFRSLSGPSGL